MKVILCIVWTVLNLVENDLSKKSGCFGHKIY